jgi:hypothetical protein
VLSRDDRVSLALLSATELPLVVAITDIGVQTGNLEPALAAALVGAAMLSVFVLPTAALARLAPATVGVPLAVAPVEDG